MSTWRNASGQPLSSKDWLDAHHKAKLPERTEFIKKILNLSPKRIVDLGCGPGIWLDLINRYAPPDCELIGIDSDIAALNIARSSSKEWGRDFSYINMDINASADQLPESDVYLAFNIFPYISDASGVLTALQKKLFPGGTVVVRQYDGALLRSGPRDQDDRSLIDNSLQISVLNSSQFRHYDMDRVFELLSKSCFKNKAMDFEIFRRFSPFDCASSDYIRRTIEWEKTMISDDARKVADAWVRSYLDDRNAGAAYFVCVDLVAFLS